MTQKTIFVQIASYRDPDCINTIDDLFSKAKYPQNIFVGLNWQFSQEDDFQPFDDTKPYSKNIRMVKYDCHDSNGVCWARKKTQELYNGETYTMQIDAHMRFVADWDIELFSMYERIEKTGVEKIVISHYPPNFSLDGTFDKNQGKMAPYVRDDGVIFFKLSGYKIDQDDSFPQLSASIAGGFWFALGSCIEEIPYDPYIYFQGEEITLSVRFFTYGWNIYNPSKIILYHLFKKKVDEESGQKVNVRDIVIHQDDNKDHSRLEKASKQRVKYLLGTSLDIDSENLSTISSNYFGIKRSIYEYENFSGLDFKNRSRSHFSRLGIYFKEALPPSLDNMKKTLDQFIITQNKSYNYHPFNQIFKLLNISLILDLVSGNSTNLINSLEDSIKYTAISHSQSVIENMRFRYRNEKQRVFIKQNIFKESLPYVDAVYVDDFFDRCSLNMGYNLLRNISKSGIKYLFSVVSLNKAPYYLHKPIFYIPLSDTQNIGVWEMQTHEIYTYGMDEKNSLIRKDIIRDLEFYIDGLEKHFEKQTELFYQFLELIEQNINSKIPREFYNTKIKNIYTNKYSEDLIENIFQLRYVSKWSSLKEKYRISDDKDQQFVIALVHEYLRLFLNKIIR